ncbi:hypothetical protein [Hyphomicrobium sp. D-2]|nr:hypothetical protein [Hyphomicrobium sp. D-2]MDH4983702.1 hypothetical protein [Hyphomicrobium sp. D-2]
MSVLISERRLFRNTLVTLADINIHPVGATQPFQLSKLERQLKRGQPN